MFALRFPRNTDKHLRRGGFYTRFVLIPVTKSINWQLTAFYLSVFGRVLTRSTFDLKKETFATKISHEYVYKRHRSVQNNVTYFMFKILTSSVLKVRHFIYLDKSVPRYYQFWLHLGSLTIIFCVPCATQAAQCMVVTCVYRQDRVYFIFW